jgi:ABC-type amino acid transport system permease subunit
MMFFYLIFIILPLVIFVVASFFLARYAFRKLVTAENKYPMVWGVTSFIVALAFLCVVYVTAMIYLFPFER